METLFDDVIIPKLSVKTVLNVCVCAHEPMSSIVHITHLN